jgi:hypothetical protein
MVWRVRECGEADVTDESAWHCICIELAKAECFPYITKEGRHSKCPRFRLIEGKALQGALRGKSGLRQCKMQHHGFIQERFDFLYTDLLLFDLSPKTVQAWWMKRVFIAALQFLSCRHGRPPFHSSASMR